MVVSIIMLVSGYNNIILLPNCTLLYYVFSGPLSLCAYVPEIKFNNNNIFNTYKLCNALICNHIHVTAETVPTPIDMAASSLHL